MRIAASPGGPSSGAWWAEAAAGEEVLRETIRVRYNAFLKQARREVGPGGSARVSKLMAMTFAAGTPTGGLFVLLTIVAGDQTAAVALSIEPDHFS